MQNAVDACRERRAIEGEGYRGHVVVRIDQDDAGKKTFTITDNGVGMTEDVILNYFLKAGSSYRNSIEWKKEYGEKGVLRVGQFGIGVLAAFILGESVSVATMPRGNSLGYRFTMHRNEYDVIDIVRDSFQDEKYSDIRNGGTRIEIDIDNPIDITWPFPEDMPVPQPNDAEPEKASHNRWFALRRAMLEREDGGWGNIPSPFMWYWPDSVQNKELPAVEYHFMDKKPYTPMALDQWLSMFKLKKKLVGLRRVLWYPESPDGESFNCWHNNIYVPRVVTNNWIWSGSVFPVIR